MGRQMGDYGFTEDEDLKISGGDFFKEESTRQHQRQLILNGKGDYKGHPLTCVNAFMFKDSKNPSEFFREIAQQYSADGQDVEFVGIEDGQMKTRAEYK